MAQKTRGYSRLSLWEINIIERIELKPDILYELLMIIYIKKLNIYRSHFILPITSRH